MPPTRALRSRIVKTQYKPEYRIESKASLKARGVTTQQCPYCDKLLSITSDLYRHIKTHTEEKRHWCEYCSYGSYQWINVKIHQRKHFSEKPEQCPNCDFCTKDPSSLTRHRKRWHAYVPPPRRERAKQPKKSVGANVKTEDSDKEKSSTSTIPAPLPHPIYPSATTSASMHYGSPAMYLPSLPNQNVGLPNPLYTSNWPYALPPYAYYPSYSMDPALQNSSHSNVQASRTGLGYHGQVIPGIFPGGYTVGHSHNGNGKMRQVGQAFGSQTHFNHFDISGHHEAAYRHGRGQGHISMDTVFPGSHPSSFPVSAPSTASSASTRELPQLLPFDFAVDAGWTDWDLDLDCLDGRSSFESSGSSS
ncbi:hypothetical protein D9758_001602 [Tetrapyrgos nigripes]|uniref:C2H2-type domain-containing protein n=1 Tax=Tetrapyrgos nigripes TaxID=182062 RepID=A0A8H5LXN1_9AGAR|nr:hypothetical protein D9758_001602 [Tetrapyrgos nigripes]